MTDSYAAYSLFHQDWWLDAVAPDQWSEVTVRRDGKIVARIPYQLEKRRGITALNMPPLTQKLGPWLAPSDAKESTRLGLEKSLMNELIDQLPPHDYFSQNFHAEVTNWLPFYWRGFQQTTRYSYVISDLTNLDETWAAVDSKCRNTIRKAETREQLQVEMTEDLNTFIDLNESVFRRQGLKPPHEPTLIRRIDAACAERDCRRIFFARDPAGRVHAALYLVWDSGAAYYLMGGTDPELRNSGAGNLLIWEAIQFSASLTRAFDFEGSMIEPIESFFRSFGARQSPYSYVSRKSNRFALIAGARDVLSKTRKTGRRQTPRT